MSSTEADATTRFTGRAQNYLRYRPGYPSGVIETLRAEAGLTADSVIADVGSGTGILTGTFLEMGSVVYGVEPNPEMRAAAEERLGSIARFRSVAARAEETTLDAASVDFVTAGQAFHWFDAAKARLEFTRILRPGGHAVVVWNDVIPGSPLWQDYEAFVQIHGLDPPGSTVQFGKDDRAVEAFFAQAPWRRRTFENAQTFDLEGYLGRFLSVSHCPPPGHPKHEPAMRALTELFARHQSGGQLRLEYATRMYFGPLA